MRYRKRKPFWIIRAIVHHLLIVIGAVSLTLVLFLVLPLMQTLAKPAAADLTLHSMEIAELEAPPPPPEDKPEPEPEPEDAPPELAEDAPPLDLAQLELALNPGFSEGWTTGDFAVKLNTVGSESQNVDTLFSVADLDQKPRVLYQPGPVLTNQIRKISPGTVYLVFVVDQQGKVENPVVQSSTDPIFEKAALAALRQWKFEPGKRNGQPVRFRMRVPITFPKG